LDRGAVSDCITIDHILFALGQHLPTALIPLLLTPLLLTPLLLTLEISS
jgi:hypothetical protein